MYIPFSSEIILIRDYRATIMGSGSAFNNQASPTVVVQVGASGSTGLAEISGMLFKTQGPCTMFLVIETVTVMLMSRYSRRSHCSRMERP